LPLTLLTSCLILIRLTVPHPFVLFSGHLGLVVWGL